MEIRKKGVTLHQKQQNQSNMVNEIIRSEGAHTTSFHVIWTTGEYPHCRTYGREFQSLKDMAKFICKHPKREYQRIYESENWYEEIENFMGFSGVHLVSCGNVVREFQGEDFLQ